MATAALIVAYLLIAGAVHSIAFRRRQRPATILAALAWPLYPVVGIVLGLFLVGAIAAEALTDE